MKNKLRAFYLWLYREIKGHLPIGTLVRFRLPYWLDSELGLCVPTAGSLGIVIGGWHKLKIPGFVDHGSVVMFGSRMYDMNDLLLEVVD